MAVRGPMTSVCAYVCLLVRGHVRVSLSVWVLRVCPCAAPVCLIAFVCVSVSVCVCVGA
jgi:hypothetical protein